MPNETLDDRDMKNMRETAMLYTKHIDKSIQRLGHIVIRLLAELASLRSQLQQRDAQLAEQGGRLLALTEALAGLVKGYANTHCVKEHRILWANAGAALSSTSSGIKSFVRRVSPAVAGS